MCGFAGLFPLLPFAPAAELRTIAERMATSIAHRGPDAQSVLVTPFAAVGFRRLAIVDLHTGDQPVQNHAGDIQVFFNGEIYNHIELREKLRKEHGVDIRHGSDAAVLPHLYEHYGPDFVELCNGMFAICVLDHRSGHCWLFRDRLGIKPLYFATTRKAVVFGSELKALFASGIVRPEIDDRACVPFLELFYVPGRDTLAKGVQKLMPGERLLLRRGLAPRRERWWQLTTPRPQRTADCLDELDALLGSATRMQLMADVPIGISLSGGLDSGLIAHYAHQADAHVRAYTITFPDTEPSELACARAVAHGLGIEHVEITAAAGDFLDELDRTTTWNDEPVADPAFYPALLVARAAARHVKVLLSGTGADELFAGYFHYSLALRERAYRLLALVLGDRLATAATRLAAIPDQRRALRSHGRSRLPFHALAMTHLSPNDRDALRGVRHHDHLQELAAAFADAAAMDPRNQQLAADTMTYLPHQLLSLLDRTTMAASIEGRVPFLDHRVAEFAMTIPGELKYEAPRGNKILLRRLAARHLPPELARRPKTGFPNSVQQWLAPSALGRVREQLLDPSGYVAGFFPRAWLQQLLGSGAALQQNAMTVHSLLVLQSWHRVFVRNAAADRPVRTAMPA